MNLEEIIRQLNLKVLTSEKAFKTIEPSAGYASDLLSCVMASAPRHGIWVTLQTHLNIIAIAALLDLSAVIITEGAEPDETTLQRANSENITVLSTTEKTFSIVGKLWEIGVKGEQPE